MRYKRWRILTKNQYSLKGPTTVVPGKAADIFGLTH